MSCSFKIDVIDMPGVTSRLLNLVDDLNINLMAMEVVPGEIYIRVGDLPECKKVKREELLVELKRLDFVKEVSDIEYMPFEVKEQELKTVMNNLKEGIVAIDKYGKISTMNKSAEVILNVSLKKSIGKDIRDILDSDRFPIIESLKKKKKIENEEILIEGDYGKSHYFTTTTPIFDEDNNLIGAVASMKDIDEVRKLYNTIHETPKIEFNDIIHQSEKMERLIEYAKRSAKNDSTIFIRGESGTGKELFARAIYSASSRSQEPFVAVNCAALPDSLLESELFGYEEGSFTGAKKGGKQGLFEIADKGTIFLDEIGEMSAHLQAKLLRTLEQNQIRKVGGDQVINIDVRVIAATNRKIEEMIRENKFREDLYYRLNVIPIIIPPLRERKEDLFALSKYFIWKITNKMRIPNKHLSPQAKKKIMSYDWPGNVRELKNVLERAINFVSSLEITADDIIFDRLRLQNNNYLNREAGDYNKDSLLKGNYVDIKEISSIKKMVGELEKLVISHTLNEEQSLRKAAEVLGVSHTTVLNKAKKYNLK
ncbi:sigma 54-interacting transcriptional regulator [Halanaerobium congolense]|jgi:transcriptional regulator of aroF, aroG, tyrA and aromatic amino acid transport|uniref:sigma 54-interacting transcriptional regulator n=1 Tax=Halanaerobium congolense TaxID=54121 RepID=UPI000886E4F2|nr:sigma 54-interacting transcriptional regulator [Halanaerobium congolense]SDH01541.1 transcriptional regulator of aroF, aroG, tyrA and aromatic amino acid transport [Halanaerobium congolense]